MNELTKDEIEALWIIEWLEPIGALTDLVYGNLSQGSTQAWWDSISPIPFGGAMTYLELENFTTEQLKREIESREASALEKPKAKTAFNPDPLIEICESYVNEAATGYVDEDLKQYIFEEAMKAVFGNDIFDYINIVLK